MLDTYGKWDTGHALDTAACVSQLFFIFSIFEK